MEKSFKVCVESWLSNNSELKEYDNYIIPNKRDMKSAREFAKKCIDNWNKESKGIIYNIFDIWEI